MSWSERWPNQLRSRSATLDRSSRGAGSDYCFIMTVHTAQPESRHQMDRQEKIASHSPSLGLDQLFFGRIRMFSDFLRDFAWIFNTSKMSRSRSIAHLVRDLNPPLMPCTMWCCNYQARTCKSDIHLYRTPIVARCNHRAPIFLWYTLNKKSYKGIRKEVKKCFKECMHITL